MSTASDCTENTTRVRTARRRNPPRARRPPLRLIVQIDENDQIPRYEERRIQVTHAMFRENDEAEESCDGDESSTEPEVMQSRLDDEEDEENIDPNTAEIDDEFVVGSMEEEEDEDYVPDSDELEEAEREEQEAEEETSMVEDEDKESDEDEED